MTFFSDAFQFIMMLFQDPIHLIKAVGYIGLVAIIFSETGLLVGFFLPGDSLLVAAGLFAARGDMSIVVLLTILTIAAIVGDAVGFYIGHRLGPVLYKKEDSFFFPKKHIIAAHEFYEKHGGKTIILARFIPILRTFVPTVAGAANMTYRRFATFNVVGGFLWIWSLLLAGYWLGQMFGDKINKYMHYLIIGIVVLSIMPLVIRWCATKLKRSES